MKRPKLCQDCPFVYTHAPMSMVNSKGLIKENLKGVLRFFRFENKDDVAKFTWGCHKKHPDIPIPQQNTFNDCAGMKLFQEKVAADPRKLKEITEIRTL